MNICHQPHHQPHPQPQLRNRAALLEKIRAFFRQHNVLEVETPLLCPSTIPSPHIHSFTTQYQSPSGEYRSHNSGNGDNSTVAATTLYLQTSPEFAMKRLLAQNSGDIYQICKAFRNEEQGRWHNPEFTILEWYRIGYDHHQLMDEMDALLQYVAATKAAQRLSYAAIFNQYLGLDPHASTAAALKQHAKQHAINGDENENDQDYWLQLLLTHVIEPQLSLIEAPIFIYDFPPSQAALAKIVSNSSGVQVASRFEVYIKGIELANGFHELTDPKEQRQRFEDELAARRERHLPCPPLDEKFLHSLAELPACAGVALGIDRLLMVASSSPAISEVLSFDINTI